MAIPAELPIGTQDPPSAPRRRRSTAVYAQFEARPERVPPLKMMSIGGSGLASIALK